MPLPHRQTAGQQGGPGRAIKLVPRKRAPDEPPKQDIKLSGPRPLRQQPQKGAPFLKKPQAPKAPPPLRSKPEAPMPKEVGTPTFFGTRYKLIERLNKGGTGTVYKAEDRMLDLTVAIKFLPERLTHDRAALTRFKHEAGIALQLSHENIVKLHNLEIDRNRVFLIMEFVEGRDFRKILNSMKSLPLVPVIQTVRACAKALDYAHECGVVHRDLKPENLMLTTDSRLKIIDFGTARRIHSNLVTDRRVIEGSPPYMSPEQMRGYPLDRRTDVYSLGAIAYEMLAGDTPVPFDGDLQTILAHEPLPITSVPKRVSEVICKAIAKERDQRWCSAGEFHNELLRAAEEAGALPKAAKP